MLHRTYGSSTAKRTNMCPPWVRESKDLPRKESAAAQDGTAVHGVCEALVLGHSVPAYVEGIEVTLDHIALAEEMVAEAEKLMDRIDIVEIEPEVHATTADDVGGTLDLIGWTEIADLLMLTDYKSGRGVQVEAEDNDQILFTAANLIHGDSPLQAVMRQHNFQKFLGVIIQPDQSGTIQTKEFEFDRARVDEWWEHHQAMIALSREGGGELNAGDWCKFCPANGLCDATTGNLHRMSLLDPEDIEQLKWALDMIPQVQTTIKRVESMAHEQLELGQKIEGWKLVQGRPGNTTWVDAGNALKKLKSVTRGKKDEDGNRLADHLRKISLITPAQVQKLLKQHGLDPTIVDGLTYRPPPKGTSVVPESDKREAVLPVTALAESLGALKK